MDFVEQEIVIQTNESEGPGIAISVGGPLLRRLEETVRPCVRMALTGKSAKVGKPPRWLRAAWDFRALSFDRRGGDTVLRVSSPTLGEAAPRVFEQQRLWDEGVRPTETALDLLGKLVSDVRAQRSESDSYDEPLLQELTGWGGLFKTKVKTLILPNASPGGQRAEMDRATVQGAKALSRRIPLSRQIRLVGRIDMVRWSTRSMAVRVSDEREYRCVVVNDEIGDLGQYGGREVTVLGQAVYRPSGSVLRLDVQEILDTTVGRVAFSEVPAPFARHLEAERRQQTAKTGVAAIFGSWPGEESEEELLAELAELRG